MVRWNDALDGQNKTLVDNGDGTMSQRVHIASGVSVTATVDLDHTEDDVLIYGNDGTTDRKIKTDTSGNVQVGIVQKQPVNEYAEVANIVSEVETTVVSYTVPAGKTLNIQGFLGTGTATGRFKLFLDSTVRGILRSSAAERSPSITYVNGVIQAAEGVVVTVKAYHEELANQTFQCNLFGYLT